MNSISLALTKHDKNVPLNVGVSPPKSGWALSDRLAWAMRLTVKPSTKLVAVAIASHAGASSGLAWPSLATLAHETGLSRRQVVYSVRDLERGGHLTVTRLRLGKVNTSNRYRLPPMGGVSQPGGGSAQAALGGSAQAAPEPVRTSEPVSKAARQRCADCGHNWPKKDADGNDYGDDCHECQKAKRNARRRPRGGLPQYHDRPLREFPPMTAAKTADAEDLALANGWRKSANGSWEKRR